MSDISTSPARGDCGGCGHRPRLNDAGVLVFHRAVLAGVPHPRCPGVGQPPVTDPVRLAALAERDRHVRDHAGRCQACDPPTYKHARPLWPCPARKAAWAAFTGAEVPA